MDPYVVTRLIVETVCGAAELHLAVRRNAQVTLGPATV
jgi:hypothetical protein